MAQQPTMELEVKAGELLQLLRLMKPVVHECYLRVNKGAIEASLVDPAHVALLELVIGKPFFTKFKLKRGADLPLELGLDIDKAIEATRLAKADQDITITYNKGRFCFKIGSINKRFAVVEPEGNQPKMPNLTWGLEVEIPRADMHLACKAADKVADAMTIEAANKELLFKAKGELDEIELKVPLKRKGTKDTVTSMFPMDYLKKAAKLIPGDTVQLHLATNYPVKITADWRSVGIAFLIAPCLENDLDEEED